MGARWARLRLPAWTDNPVVVVGLITLAGAALRLYGLGHKSLWFDEAVMYWISAGSLESLLDRNAALNSAPPTFPLLLHAVLEFGSSEAALRAVAWAAGVAAIPAIYLLARQCTTRHAAYVAPALAAVAPEQILYSQQVREYSLAALLAALLLWAFLAHLRRPAWPSALRLAALAAASLLVQYGLVFVVATVSLVWLGRMAWRRSWRADARYWLAVNAAALAAVIAVYFLALRAQFDPEGRGHAYLREGYWSGAPGELPGLAVGNTLDIVQFAFPGAFFLFLLLLGLVTALRRRQYVVLLLLLIPMGLTFVAALVRAYPYIAHRHTIYLTPMLLVFAALGIEHLVARARSQLAPMLLLALMLGFGIRGAVAELRSPGLENMRPLAHALLARAAPDEPVYVAYGARPAFLYYLRNAPRPVIGRTWGILAADTTATELPALAAALQQQPRVWLVLARQTTAEREEILALASAHRRVRLVQQERDVSLYVAE